MGPSLSYYYVRYLPAEREVRLYRGKYHDPERAPPLEDHGTCPGTYQGSRPRPSKQRGGTRVSLELEGGAIATPESERPAARVPPMLRTRGR